MKNNDHGELAGGENIVDSAILAGERMGKMESIRREEIHGVPFMVRPNDMALDSLEEFLPRPPALKQRRDFLDVSSFTDYVNTFKDAATRIYGVHNNSTYEITAVLDDHEVDGVKNGARWGRHTAVLTLRHSEEWNAWMAKNNQVMDKDEFCSMILDRTCDIIEPAHAVLLGAVRAFTSKRTTVVQDIIYDDGGYSCQVHDEANGQSSEITLPGALTVSLRPFNYFEARPIHAAIRPKFMERKNCFFYSIPAVDKVIDALLDEVRATINTETEIPVYF